MGWFSRYRHSRGFGIHSPFAYRLVTEVIEERLPYYDYEVVKDPYQRLLYRLVCRFSPQNICVIGAEVPGAFMASKRAKSTSVDDCDMLIADASVTSENLRTAIQRHTLIVVHTPQLKKIRGVITEQLADAGYGMTFDNGKDTLIIAANPKLPRQDFQVKC